MGSIGVSDVPSVRPEEIPLEGAKPTVANAAKGSETMPSIETLGIRKRTGRFWSKGHSHDRFAIDVWANDTAYAARDLSQAPLGSIWVATHYSSLDASRPLFSAWMSKRTNDGGSEWQYRTYGADQVSHAQTPACAECHSLAPYDHVFSVSP